MMVVVDVFPSQHIVQHTAGRGDPLHSGVHRGRTSWWCHAQVCDCWRRIAGLVGGSAWRAFFAQGRIRDVCCWSLQCCCTRQWMVKSPWYASCWCFSRPEGRLLLVLALFPTIILLFRRGEKYGGHPSSPTVELTHEKV